MQREDSEHIDEDAPGVSVVGDSLDVTPTSPIIDDAIDEERMSFWMTMTILIWDCIISQISIKATVNYKLILTTILQSQCLLGLYILLCQEFEQPSTSPQEVLVTETSFEIKNSLQGYLTTRLEVQNEK